MKEYIACIKHYIADEEKQRRRISEYAALRVSRDIKEHMRGNKDNTVMMERIRHTLALLGPFIDVGNPPSANSNIQEYLILRDAEREETLQEFINKKQIDFAETDNTKTMFLRKRLKALSAHIKTLFYYGLKGV